MPENRDDYMQQEQGAVAITDIRFETVFDQAPDGSTRATDWVQWRKAGEALGSVTRIRVAALRPTAKNPHGAVEWGVIGPAYEAWKAGNEIPVDGTPLEAWNGLARDEIERLKIDLGVNTIEAFANMPESAIQKARVRNPRERVERAKRFLEARSQTAEVEKAMAERDAQIAELREMVQALSASQEAPKRGPGRPRKTEAAVE